MSSLIALFIISLIGSAIRTSILNSRKKSTVNVNVKSQELVMGSIQKKSATWYGVGDAVNIEAFNITAGLIYVGEKLSVDKYGGGNEASLINPKLSMYPVKEGEEWKHKMGYWPKYESISSYSRGVYLKWLADGRNRENIDIGYVFLFFYGLERRLLVDAQQGKVSENERLVIVQEIIRLLKIYGSNGSFHRYANNLLAMEWTLYQNDKSIQNYINFEDGIYLEVLHVFLFRNYVLTQKPIPADVALKRGVWYLAGSFRTPIYRCKEEFFILFEKRYKEKFGDGIILKANDSPVVFQYHAASPSLNIDLDLKIPNIKTVFMPAASLTQLEKLLEECTVLLDSYSRYLGRKGDPNTVIGLSFLPKDLMGKLPRIKKIQLILFNLCQGGHILISLQQLYKVFGDKVPEKFNTKESEVLSILIENMGYGIIPNIKFHNLKPMLDCKVLIFKNGHGCNFSPSKEFQIMTVILRLGAMVTHAKQDTPSLGEKILQNLIKGNDKLNEIEKRFLTEFLYWCLRVLKNVTLIKQKLSDMSNKEKTAISQILIAVANSEGYIKPEQIKKLEKLYVMLGLSKEQVSNDIHQVSIIDNEPVTVALRDGKKSFHIKNQELGEDKLSGFVLNKNLIKIREEETLRVKGVLSEIFSEQGEDKKFHVTQESATAVQLNYSASPLDEKHYKFLKILIKKEMWDRKLLYDRCKELGLMLDGALEVLNEWAFDKVNAALIDGDDPINIDLDIAKELMNDR